MPYTGESAYLHICKPFPSGMWQRDYGVPFRASDIWSSIKKGRQKSISQEANCLPSQRFRLSTWTYFLFCYAEDNSYPSEFIHHFMNKIKTHLQILLHKQATSFLNHQIQHSPLQWVRDELSLTAFARYIQTAETRLASSTSWRFATTKCCLAR